MLKTLKTEKNVVQEVFSKIQKILKKSANLDQNWQNFQKIPIFMLLLPIFQYILGLKTSEW